MQLDEDHSIQNNECSNIALIWNNLENVSINTSHYVHTVGNTNYGRHQLLHSTFNFRGLQCAVPGFPCLLKKEGRWPEYKERETGFCTSDNIAYLYAIQVTQEKKLQGMKQQKNDPRKE
jgi:hypothetical protein